VAPALFLIFVLILFTTNSSAQVQEFSSSPNPVGSGARAMGMGGAFIGIADDATAASWNPGGLIQLETPEISGVYSRYQREESYSDEQRTEFSPPDTTTTSVDARSNSLDVDALNYLSLAAPFSAFERNVVISLNHQHLFDFSKNVRQTGNTQIDSVGSGGEIVDIHDDFNLSFVQGGGLYAISPAAAVQVTPSFSFGATFNLWENILDGRNGWKKRQSQISVRETNITIPMPAPIPDIISNQVVRETTTLASEYRFSGFNMNIGFLWDLTEMITLGAVVKTPFTADVDRVITQSREEVDITDPNNPSVTVPATPVTTREKLDLKMPMSYGLGLALRFSDAFTVDLDVYRTEWDDFRFTDASGNETRPINGQPVNRTEVDATHQIRLGGEYLFILPTTVIPVRAGVFYDPEPSINAPNDYYGVSAGTGFMWGNLVMDVAYQYRWGDGIDGLELGTVGTTVDVEQHQVLASAILHF